MTGSGVARLFGLAERRVTNPPCDLTAIAGMFSRVFVI
jgi:hypothetical protein